MSKIDIKVGDLVKLRDDLEDGKFYGTNIFIKNMKFKGFKKVKFSDTDTGGFNIDGMTLWYTKEMIAEVKRPCKYKTIYKREEPILDDKEKEYLSAVIKPFRDRVKTISKKRAGQDFIYEYIEISLPNDNYAYLPDFKTATMYKGMKLNKKYTLKELGL